MGEEPGVVGRTVSQPMARETVEYSYCLSEPASVQLSDYSPGHHAGLKREQGADLLQQVGDELEALQELLYAAGKHSLLVVLQGLDAGGKDGTVRSVMGFVNPQGVQVSSFKVPTEEEQRHDFLWRVHQRVPARGIVGVFNRSHYEDVLVARVHKLVPEAIWRKRYDAINDFEALLAENGTLIAKFFLHISKDEQRERLLAREADPGKAWKLNVGDWKERAYWDAYQAAYEEALSRCSTPHAPWFVVPANHKWYRNLAVAEALAKRLRPHVSSWREELDSRGAEERKQLEALRDSGEIS
jgi:PPK2 family polyphosphate:nucleotide phosphotransferase